jgi:mRNA interferase YafQ
MREIKYTNRFRRDYKREQSGQYGKKLDVVLMQAVNMLAAETV